MGKLIALFEAWSVKQIADQINAAVSGMGTDEAKLVNAVKQIKDKSTLWQVNNIMKSSDNYAYASVRKAVDGELGGYDETEKKAIYAHLKSLGSTDDESDNVKPKPSPDQVITSIIPRVKQHEGVKPKKYIDSRGIPTVGVGFNLTRQDSTALLKSVGANAAAVKAGQASLTQAQMDELLKHDLKVAKDSAVRLVPNFAVHPAAVQGVLIEMVFNLGEKGLSEFKNFLANVKAKNYKQASVEMLDSAWASQVGDRSKTLSNIMRNA